MQIKFGNQEFIMHASGLLSWPAQSMALVSDLHLEKGSHFARRGFFVPPYDTNATLTNLTNDLAQIQPQRLLVLGDTFHDSKGFERLNDMDRALFESLKAFKPIWVRGNHDGAYVPEGFDGHDEYKVDGIAFRHEASHADDFEISGHYHPRADIKYKGARISKRCFVESAQKLILPAYGAYTGGLSVQDRAIARFFDGDYRLHVLGEKVYSLDAASIMKHKL